MYNISHWQLINDCLNHIYYNKTKQSLNDRNILKPFHTFWKKSHINLRIYSANSRFYVISTYRFYVPLYLLCKCFYPSYSAFVTFLFCTAKMIFYFIFLSCFTVQIFKNELSRNNLLEKQNENFNAVPQITYLTLCT